VFNILMQRRKDYALVSFACHPGVPSAEDNSSTSSGTSSLLGSMGWRFLNLVWNLIEV
jgi:hypothetical protein